MLELISARDLHRAFGANHAVDGIDLSVRPGEIYGLVGADGAGKTTVLRLLVGALRPDRGSAAICGHDIRLQTEQARACLGYLSQRFSLYEDMTVLENIRFFAEVRGLKARAWLPRCMEILDFVGLLPFKDRFAGQLSGGMKQKLGLASALVTRPQVLLLDEPTTGVDPVTRQDFWQLLVRLVSDLRRDERTADQSGAVSVIISTPYMDEAARCSRIGFMSRGRLIAEGSPSELRATLAGRVIELSGTPLRAMKELAQQDAGVEDVRAFGDRLHLRVAAGQAEAVMHRLRQDLPRGGISLGTMRAVAPVLEDVFIALTTA